MTVVGNNVTLLCNVSNENLVKSYFWYFIVSDPSGTTGFGTPVINIGSIHRDTSEFICIVTDIFGIEYNDTFSLIIQGEDTVLILFCFVCCRVIDTAAYVLHVPYCLALLPGHCFFCEILDLALIQG